MEPQAAAIVEDLDDALKRLVAIDARKSDILQLLFFGGLTYKETVQRCILSPATVHRETEAGKGIAASRNVTSCFLEASNSAEPIVGEGLKSCFVLRSNGRPELLRRFLQQACGDDAELLREVQIADLRRPAKA